MPKPLDPTVGSVLKDFGFGRDAIWDCHGTWVVYHRVLEQIAAKAGIEFDLPMALEANGPAKTVALCVAGKCGGRTEWSIGEAAPGNNKNAYPYAMAEKRAKDRVILKLIGLHGLVYSEDEADDFRESAPNGNTRRSSYSIKQKAAKGEGDEWGDFMAALESADTVAKVDALQKLMEQATFGNWPTAYVESAKEELDKRRDALSANGSEPTKAEYAHECLEIIDGATDITALKKWWDGEKPARTRYRFTQEDVDALKAKVLAKIQELGVPKADTVNAADALADMVEG